MSAASKAPPERRIGFPRSMLWPDQTPLTQEVPVQGKVKLELKSR